MKQNALRKQISF